MVFLSDKVPKVSIVPFFYFPIIVLKLTVCLILKAALSVFKPLLLPTITLHLNRVLPTFSFTCVTICALIYATCCFVVFNLFSTVFAAGFLFLYSQLPMDKFLDLGLKKARYARDVTAQKQNS